jgi:riboflavin biosynthesis pyrimidine reductase
VPDRQPLRVVLSNTLKLPADASCSARPARRRWWSIVRHPAPPRRGRRSSV